VKSKLFILFFIVALITFFTKDSYKSVVDIDPQVLREPIQTQEGSYTPITFTKDGFSYKVMPLYSYDLAGLVVHKQIYNAWYSLSRVDSVFPIDVCMIWGANIRSGIYKAKDAKFTQDFRFCLFSYGGNIPILNEGISNNHFVISNEKLEKLAKAINAGDQVRIRGKLANVEARPLTSAEKYEPDNLIWNTSITRADIGAGACETIYVESIEILKKGNPISNFLFTASIYSMLAIILIGVLSMLAAFFQDPLRKG
jgi:hypothetical protein